jgi:hypothetical protein
LAINFIRVGFRPIQQPRSQFVEFGDLEYFIEDEAHIAQGAL